MATDQHTRSQLRAWLAGPGCPTCAEAGRWRERWARWFHLESHTEPATIETLRAGPGLCPAHTRTLVASGDAARTLRGPLGQVVSAAIDLLRDARATARTCSACVDEHAATDRMLDALVGHLGDQELAAALADADGLCAGHLLDSVEAAVSVAGLAAATHRLVDRMAATADDQALIAVMSRADHDAPARRRLLLAERAVPSPRASALAQLRARLGAGSCPACQAAGEALHGYLAWLPEQDLANIAFQNELTSVCDPHLHDIRAAQPALAAWAAVRHRDRLLPGLEALRDLARTLPERRLPGPAATPRRASPPGRWRRVLATLVADPGQRIRAHLDTLPQRGSCPACKAVAAVERRTLELLVPALGDTRTRAAYEAAQGLCLEHVLALRRHGLGSRLVEAQLATRLTTARWELDEAARRDDWSFRHEPRGSEMSAWRRTLALLDGRVTLGLPPQGVDTDASG